MFTITETGSTSMRGQFSNGDDNAEYTVSIGTQTITNVQNNQYVTVGNLQPGTAYEIQLSVVPAVTINPQKIIVIRNNANKDAVSLAEVQVYPTSSTGSNIAPLGTADQSSTDYGGVASRAIDGNTSGWWSHGSVTHTTRDQASSEWWRLQLQTPEHIDRIVIWNREDCCNTRLNGATLEVYDEFVNMVGYTTLNGERSQTIYMKDITI